MLYTRRLTQTFITHFNRTSDGQLSFKIFIITRNRLLYYYSLEKVISLLVLSSRSLNKSTESFHLQIFLESLRPDPYVRKSLNKSCLLVIEYQFLWFFSINSKNVSQHTDFNLTTQVLELKCSVEHHYSRKFQFSASKQWTLFQPRYIFLRMAFSTCL